MQIEHDPHEPKIDRGNWIYWLAWAVVAVLWVGALGVGLPIDWFSICLGAISTAVLIIHVTEKTGNKPPDWMRR